MRWSFGTFTLGKGLGLLNLDEFWAEHFESSLCSTSFHPEITRVLVPDQLCFPPSIFCKSAASSLLDGHLEVRFWLFRWDYRPEKKRFRGFSLSLSLEWHCIIGNEKTSTLKLLCYR